MNQDTFAGQWQQMRGALKSWWGKLSDNDFDSIKGQTDKLIGVIQEKYGYARDKAQQEVERRFREYSAKMGDSGESVASMKTKAQEFASTAANKAHEATTVVGQKLGSLAGLLRENTPQEGRMGSAANVMAHGLEAAGSYLHDKSFENMTTDLTALIRRYPIQSLFVGIGIGYLLTRRTER
ncbi:MAG: CsbD family protein [Candidatus Binatia bacterium]